MNEFFKYFTLKDLLDIALVYIIIYNSLKFLVSSNGAKILKGFLILVILWIFSYLLDLKTVLFIFDKFWTVGIFSFIIIFQPEIRKALSKIGEAKIVQVKSNLIEEKTIDRIARAASFLADRQIGALIIIERVQALDELIEGCTLIDSEISVELLITIFYPMTPLHDGAVIIKNNRIAYASCILPLSKSKDLPKKFGTRHRAAVGITEESDALAVVVSEETGEISLASRGSVVRNLDFESLVDNLKKELNVQ